MVLTDDFLDEHRRVLDQRLHPVIREITDSRARTRDELEGTSVFKTHQFVLSNLLHNIYAVCLHSFFGTIQ